MRKIRRRRQEPRNHASDVIKRFFGAYSGMGRFQLVLDINNTRQ